MKEASKRLRSLVEAAEPKLREISESESIQPILPGGWSRKQIIGHLSQNLFRHVFEIFGLGFSDCRNDSSVAGRRSFQKTGPRSS